MSGFSTEQYNVNWVNAWTSATQVEYTFGEDSILHSYAVIAFKGFSMLTNLGYEVTVPERESEMVVAIISQNIKVVINAYILGVFHTHACSDANLRELASISHEAPWIYRSTSSWLHNANNLGVRGSFFDVCGLFEIVRDRGGRKPGNSFFNVFIAAPRCSTLFSYVCT
jgi:hypothetical protein